MLRILVISLIVLLFSACEDKRRIEPSSSWYSSWGGVGRIEHVPVRYYPPKEYNVIEVRHVDNGFLIDLNYLSSLSKPQARRVAHSVEEAVAILQELLILCEQDRRDKSAEMK